MGDKEYKKTRYANKLTQHFFLLSVVKKIKKKSTPMEGEVENEIKTHFVHLIVSSASSVFAILSFCSHPCPSKVVFSENK